ncbi:MAG: hypothetical protein ABIP14_04285 [Blastocatellia bacterium]
MKQDVPHDRTQDARCRICGETINPSLTNCPYCGAVIDSAESPVRDLSPISNACKEATFLKAMARLLVACFLALVLSFVENFALWAFLIFLTAVPMMLVRWWIKYRNLQTTDQNYATAKRDVAVAAVIWVGVIIVWLSASLIMSWRQMSR